MLVSMRWLARHVDLDGISPEELCNDLTLSTAEVDGLERFAPHLADLMRMSGFTARVVFGAEPIEETDRKSLARRLHSAVASRFIPMHPDEDACLTSRTFPASS